MDNWQEYFQHKPDFFYVDEANHKVAVSDTDGSGSLTYGDIVMQYEANPPSFFSHLYITVHEVDQVKSFDRISKDNIISFLESESHSFYFGQ